ncbi:MAG: hypothetical protein IJ600_09630 [Lachnospiraceae bacterium]|nr:hypothetical protein [Lachnospiraceae bacterium]
MAFLTKYKFTNRQHPLKAVMAVNLALIGLGAIGMAVWLGYRHDGAVEPNHAAAVFLAQLMAMAGLGLAIAGRLEPNSYRFFPDLGIFLNLLVLVCGGLFVFLGLA